jgi:hypothetical protein
MPLANEILLDVLTFQNRHTLTHLQLVNRLVHQLIQQEFSSHPYKIFPNLTVKLSQEEDTQYKDCPTVSSKQTINKFLHFLSPLHKVFRKRHVQDQKEHRYRVTCCIPNRRRLTFHQFNQMFSGKKFVRFASTEFSSLISSNCETVDYFHTFVEMFREMRFLWRGQRINIGG